MYKLLNYQREEKHTDLYSEKLAKSMHLAFQKDDKAFEPLNQNYGILFAKAYEAENEVLHPKQLINSWLLNAKNDEFVVVAVRVNPDGSADEISKGSILVFESKNLLEYTELPLLQLSDETIVDVTANYDALADQYLINWQEENGSCYQVAVADFTSKVDLSNKKEIDKLPLEDFTGFETEIEGVIPRNTIKISDELGDYLVKKLITPHNIEIKLPETIEASSQDELDAVRATAVYSDGTTATKKVDWFSREIDFDKPGEYEIKGKIHQDHYPFPIAWDRADPCVGKWNGKYYFIATNDADGNNSLYIREADTIPELVTAQEIRILDTQQYPEFKSLLWAPEFHIVNNRLYIFHAGSSNGFVEQACQVMALKEGGNPLIREDWEKPKMSVKTDGKPLIEAGKGITLDMTVIPNKGRYFASWSHRPLQPNDLGAWICFAEIDPDEPWKLISDIITIAKPDYGWDNNHTPVVEGPYPLIRDGKIFLTISGAAVDSTYAVGLLTADVESDLLDPNSWVKTNYPLLTLNDVEGEYGPGHNAYVIDEDGDVWNTYHARPGLNEPRSSGVRRVHFDVDGYPVLALTEEKDLNPDLTIVSATIIVK